MKREVKLSLGWGASNEVVYTLIPPTPQNFYHSKYYFRHDNILCIRIDHHQILQKNVIMSSSYLPSHAPLPTSHVDVKISRLVARGEMPAACLHSVPFSMLSSRVHIVAGKCNMVPSSVVPGGHWYFS